MGVVLVTAGKPSDAIKVLEGALSISPSNVAAYLSLGQACMAVGRTDRGLQAFRRAYELAPSRVDVGYNLGVALIQSRAFDEAIPILERIRNKKDAPPHTLMNLGIALFHGGTRDKGLQIMRRALAQAPRDPHVLLNLGSMQMQANEPDAALKTFEALKQLAPNMADAYIQTAVIHEKQGDSWHALKSLEDAVRIAPKHPYAHLNLAKLQLSRGDYRSAKEHATASADLLGNSYESIANLVHAQQACDGADRAIKTIEDNIGRMQGEHRARLQGSLLNCLQSAGQFDRARAIIGGTADMAEKAWKLLPVMAADRSYDLDELSEVADYALAHVDDVAEDREICGPVWFALAAYFDRCKDPERSADCLLKANAIRNSEVAPQDPYDDDWVADNREVFLDKRVRDLERAGDATAAPVFVVGLPRSGTTLTEQMIAAHPECAAAGEFPGLNTVENEMAARFGLSAAYPAAMRELKPENIGELAPDYLRMLGAVTGDARFGVNKMTGNVWRIGLILTLFPNARVIHCRRNLAATGLSIFQQNFTGDHPYAYDWARIERHVGRYLEVSAFWDELYGDRIYELWYEDLIQSPREAMESLVGYLGVDWDDRMLRHHEADRSIKTASLWQARQPIYTSSSEKWRQYQPYFPQLAELDAMTPKRRAG